MRIATPILIIFLVCFSALTRAQDSTSILGKITNFPGKFFSKINSKTADLNKQLTKQTERYLSKLARQEAKLKKQLYKYDSSTAKRLFAVNPNESYAAFIQKMKTDTSKNAHYMGGEYQPNLDSLQTALAFLNENPQAINMPSVSAVPGASLLAMSPAASTLAQLQQLQAKMQNADYIKQYVQARKTQIQQYLMSLAHLPPGVSGVYQNYKKQLYYYSQQVRAYQEQLNDPDKMMGTALGLLYKLPAFNAFMQKNSFLAGMFGISPDYGTPQGVEGMQTRDQLTKMIQSKIGGGGSSASAAITQSLQTAKQDISNLRTKLSALGAGNGNMDMPDFKPNNQKTKTLFQRLEYGTNLQTTQSSYFFPITTDIGLSVGYKIFNGSTIGIGASYKIGWGSDIQHIGLSSQGASLRSFVDIQAKKSFYLSGGFEYNYQPLTGADLGYLKSWQQSGLIGVSKIISMNTKVFKKTKVSVLWDFLSYQQIPRAEPFVFRVGYSF